jgi:thiol:disulfide interchange protein DsbD
MQKAKYLKNTVRVVILAGLTFWGAMIGFSTESCLAQNQSNKLLVSPIKASLSSETQLIVPGKPFKLFVSYDMEPGWHIYYKDPGQSGMPTQVDLMLPKGFTAQALSWPPAETYKEAGIVTYGYSKKVRLSTMVTPSKGLKSGESVSIKAAAKWLACKHSCVPGNSKISLDLKVETK